MLAAPVAWAQYEPGLLDVSSARTFGMGGTAQALGFSADSVDENPATMSLFRRYQLEFSGAWDFGNNFAFGSASIVDSSTNRLAIGVAYHIVSFGPPEARRLGQVSTVGAALPLSDFVHVGISFRHLLMSGSANANALTGDAGLVIRPSEAFALALSAHNLVDTFHEELPRYYAGGLGFTTGTLSAGLDAQATPRAELPIAWRVNGGVEYILGVVPLRAGYSWDSATGGKLLSVGAGFVFEGGGLDIAYRHDIGGVGRLLAITLKIGGAQ